MILLLLMLGVAQETTSGLAVHVGATDGLREIDLARTGGLLVHGLALDLAARERARTGIRATGLYPLASVETWTESELPYADNLVNLLVADVDGLGSRAPPEAEILRVLCPGGEARLKMKGVWTKTVKKRPAELGEWTHFDHGADGNGVSRDRCVRPPTFLQWTSGVQEIKLGGNPAGFVNLSGIRVADGRTVFDYQSGPQALLAARDAWNGVPLWTIPRDKAGAHRRWQVVATQSRIFTFLGGKLVALDAATGKPAIVFERAAAPRLPEEGTQVRVGSRTLLVNLEDGLHALDPGTGNLLWSYAEAGQHLVFPCLAEDAGLAFAASIKPGQTLRSRWPSALVDAVVGLDVRTGKPVWRNVDVAGKPIGQLIHADGQLALFAGSAIGGRQKEGGWVSAIGAADGKLAGEGTFKSAYNDSMYNAVVRDGAVWYAGHTSLYRFEPGPGRITRMTNLSYNQRCNRFTATTDLWLLGYITYLDATLNGTLQTPARAGCALGTTPANGMIYLTPSACTCFTQLRGYQALSPEPLRASVDALERGGAADASRSAQAPSGPIADDWTRGLPKKETEAVEVDGLQIVAVAHEHRVEARRAGVVVWSVTADGRVSHAPLVHDGRAYFGSHDGWVYAVSLADGGRQWRRRVAPYARKVVAYGQLESSWPIYGLTLHEGRIVASAGTHPELGGGVFVAGLDPQTGETAWKKTLFKPPAAITTVNGKSSGLIVPRSFLNEAPLSEGGRLRIGDFSFDPGESDAETRVRLSTPLPRKP